MKLSHVALAAALLFNSTLSLNLLNAASPPLDYSVTWCGNSFSGKEQWVAQNIAALFVTPAGDVYTNVVWDEAGGNVQKFDRDGAQVFPTIGHTHGWCYEGGAAVAANDKYLFVAQQVNAPGAGLQEKNAPGADADQSFPPPEKIWWGVSRRDLQNPKRGVPFAGGHGRDGDVLKRALLVSYEIPDRRKTGGDGDYDYACRGLRATNEYLYVADPFNQRVKIYDAEQMTLLEERPVERPVHLALDRRGRLWVSQRPSVSAAAGEPWRLLCLDAQPNASSAPAPLKIVTLAAGVVPSGFAFDRNNRLLLADDGDAQQIKIYANVERQPAQFTTLGAEGGILAPPAPGAVGPLRFNHLTGVGADDDGNLYIASSGGAVGAGTVLESYNSRGALRWRRLGLTFVNNGMLDERTGADIFTPDKHFTVNFREREPGAEWRYAGYTVNAKKYPGDPRLHRNFRRGWGGGWVRWIEGKRFLFIKSDYGADLLVCRFAADTDGETAVPCAWFSSRGVDSPLLPGCPAGAWCWRDANLNGSVDAGELTSLTAAAVDSLKGGGFVPDRDGGLWFVHQNTLAVFPVNGLDANGVPRWNLDPAPLPLSLPTDAIEAVRRFRYAAGADILLLAGSRGADKNQHWKPMGPVLAAYGKWSLSHSGPALWSVTLPYETGASGHESAEPISFDTAGDYVFIAYTRGLPDDGLPLLPNKRRNAFVKILRLADGQEVGNLSPLPVTGETGLLDLVDNNVAAYRRPDGEYVIFLEDDYKSKVVIFRWKP